MIPTNRLTVAFLLWVLRLSNDCLVVDAFTAVANKRLVRTNFRTATSTYASFSVLGSALVASDTNLIKESLTDMIESTDRGRSCTDEEKEMIEETLLQLEKTNLLSEPTRSPLTGGSWTVEYTTAPPPSNGQLGPFKGIAKQVISLENGSYQNILEVPPNDWLKASLDAKWIEWDGVLIEDDEESISKWTGKKPQAEKDSATAASITEQENDTLSSSSSSPFSFLDNLLTKANGSQKNGKNNNAIDYGATCWRVTFESITISLLGVPLFTKKFDKGTQRIWRTTYLDENTRIVRAGRTGKKDDELVFYMTRSV